MILVKVQEEGRTLDKPWRTSYEEKKPMYREAPCILLLEFSQSKNVYTLRKIFWLKFALIEATNFISRRFGLMTFFKTVCFHTGQDKNLNTMKVGEN